MFYARDKEGDGTMSAKEFGGLLGRRMAELGISQNRLASRLGELSDGRVFDATQVRLLREGRRRLDHELVGKLIQILGLPEDEAWYLAGLWPDDLSLDDYRRVRRELAVAAGTSRNALTGQYEVCAGQVKSGARVIRFPVERRQRDRPDRRALPSRWRVVADVDHMDRSVASR